jgi:hypothetical protein
LVSIFHVLGRYSYIVDSNFDDREQLSDWIHQLKTIPLAAGPPAVISLQTQKVIDVFKQKKDFDLKDYQALTDRHHFFMLIDNPHHDAQRIEAFKKMRIVHSILHVQGASAFIVEIITESYDSYRSCGQGQDAQKHPAYRDSGGALGQQIPQSDDRPSGRLVYPRSTSGALQAVAPFLARARSGRARGRCVALLPLAADLGKKGLP